MFQNILEKYINHDDNYVEVLLLSKFMKILSTFLKISEQFLVIRFGWMILKACQSMKGYFLPFIVRSYLHFLIFYYTVLANRNTF